MLRMVFKHVSFAATALCGVYSKWREFVVVHSEREEIAIIQIDCRLCQSDLLDCMQNVVSAMKEGNEFVS